jgi:hypothetical protein
MAWFVSEVEVPVGAPETPMGNKKKLIPTYHGFGLHLDNANSGSRVHGFDTQMFKMHRHDEYNHTKNIFMFTWATDIGEMCRQQANQIMTTLRDFNVELSRG